MITFAEVWPFTSKVGRKELMAKKWQQYSPELKQRLFDKIKSLNKPNPSDIIK